MAPVGSDRLITIIDNVSYSGRTASREPMNTFASILFYAIFVAFLAGVYALINKGSRPPQPLPEHLTSPRRAAVGSLIPVVCTAILYGTFKILDVYLRGHLSVPRTSAVLIMVFGVIIPWCVGIYFAYRTARTANKALRAIGSIEVLIFLLAAAVPILARG